MGENLWRVRKLTINGFCEYVVAYQLRSHVASFLIWEVSGVEASGKVVYRDVREPGPSFCDDIPQGGEYLRGDVKWDGCVNMSFGEQTMDPPCMLHFCGPESDPQLGVLMRAIYSIGSELESADFAPIPWPGETSDLDEGEVEL